MAPPLDPPHPIHQQAADIATDPGVLGMLARHRDRRVRRLIASNPAAPAERLLWLLEEFPGEVMANPALLLGSLANPGLFGQVDERLRWRWAGSDRAPRWLHEQIACDPSPYVRARLAASRSAPVDLLERLCDDPADWVKDAAVTNPALPPARLDRMARGPDRAQRRRVARNPSAPPATLAALAGDDDPDVRLDAVRNPSLPTDALDRFADHPVPWVRQHVAWRTGSLAVLEALAGDREPAVRRLAVGNPLCPVALLERMVDDVSESVRQRVAARLAGRP